VGYKAIATTGGTVSGITLGECFKPVSPLDPRAMNTGFLSNSPRGYEET